MDILLVDDDETFCRLLGRMLAARGHLLRMTHSGEEALQCVEKDPPDLVLSDLCMPGMDGIELLRRLGERHPSLPVVLMTAYDRAAEAFQYGAYGYLPKPVKPEALLAGIGRLERRAAGPPPG